MTSERIGRKRRVWFLIHIPSSAPTAKSKTKLSGTVNTRGNTFRVRRWKITNQGRAQMPVTRRKEHSFLSTADRSHWHSPFAPLHRTYFDSQKLDFKSCPAKLKNGRLQTWTQGICEETRNQRATVRETEASSGFPVLKFRQQETIKCGNKGKVVNRITIYSNLHLSHYFSFDFF